jgi:hypothetical protein
VDLPEIVLRGALRREGFGDDEVRRLRRAGRLNGRLLKPGQNPAEAVYLEKLLEDALRADVAGGGRAEAVGELVDEDAVVVAAGAPCSVVSIEPLGMT